MQKPQLATWCLAHIKSSNKDESQSGLSQSEAAFNAVTHQSGLMLSRIRLTVTHNSHVWNGAAALAEPWVQTKARTNNLSLEEIKSRLKPGNTYKWLLEFCVYIWQEHLKLFNLFMAAILTGWAHVNETLPFPVTKLNRTRLHLDLIYYLVPICCHYNSLLNITIKLKFKTFQIAAAGTTKWDLASSLVMFCQASCSSPGIVPFTGF